MVYVGFQIKEGEKKFYDELVVAAKFEERNTASFLRAAVKDRIRLVKDAMMRR